METKMKRIVCLALAALMLLAFAACGGKSGKTSEESKVKKDQIVHVGETVQYGRLKFKFVDYETNNRINKIDIILECEIISGDNVHEVYVHNFVFYEDGKLIGEGAGIEKNGYADGWDSEFYDKEIYPGRGPVEMTIRQWYSASASRIEIDYRDSDYTREWGKLTFVVDLP